MGANSGRADGAALCPRSPKSPPHIPFADVACRNAQCPADKARERFADAGGLCPEAVLSVKPARHAACTKRRMGADIPPMAPPVGLRFEAQGYLEEDPGRFTGSDLVAKALDCTRRPSRLPDKLAACLKSKFPQVLRDAVPRRPPWRPFLCRRSCRRHCTRCRVAFRTAQSRAPTCGCPRAATPPFRRLRRPVLPRRQLAAGVAECMPPPCGRRKPPLSSP